MSIQSERTMASATVVDSHIDDLQARKIRNIDKWIDLHLPGKVVDKSWGENDQTMVLVSKGHWFAIRIAEFSNDGQLIRVYKVDECMTLKAAKIAAFRLVKTTRVASSSSRPSLPNLQVPNTSLVTSSCVTGEQLSHPIFFDSRFDNPWKGW
jgi:hypothetical protein